jgi:hypothetical protein
MEASQSKIGADGRMTLIQSLAREEIRREWEVEAAQSKRSFEALCPHLRPELFAQSQRKIKTSKPVLEPKPSSDYLTTNEAAALAKRHPNMIRAWCRQKLIECSVPPTKYGKPGRNRLIPIEPFKRWLKEHRTNAPEE